MTPLLIDLCLACLDQVSAWIDQMQITGEIPADADAKADDLVRRFSSLGAADKSPILPQRAARPRTRRAPGCRRSPGRFSRRRSCCSRSRRRKAPRDGWNRPAGSSANVLRHQGRSLDANDLEGLLQTSLLAGDAASMAAAIDRVLEGLTEPAPPPPGTLPAQPPDVTLRVDVERIDALVRLTGELLIAKNAIGHSAGLAQDAADPRQLATALKNQHLLLERLVGELQRAVLSLRVLPLHHAFQRFPRLVREMATSLAKPARLMIEGATTEADKTIVEAISEPLLHVLRNSLDHGLESAAERAAAGQARDGDDRASGRAPGRARDRRSRG